MTPVFDEDQRKAPNDQSTKLTHEYMNKDTKSITGRSIILKGGVIFITPPPPHIKSVLYVIRCGSRRIVDDAIEFK